MARQLPFKFPKLRKRAAMEALEIFAYLQCATSIDGVKKSFESDSAS